VSIWCSWPTIGRDEDDEIDNAGPCLTYWEGRSNHYPKVGEEFPAAVSVDSIPAFCMPGADVNDDTGEDVAPWLRLCLMTTAGRSFHNVHGTAEDRRPMIHDGGTVVLSRAAVTALRDQLTEWLALDYREDA